MKTKKLPNYLYFLKEKSQKGSKDIFLSREEARKIKRKLRKEGRNPQIIQAWILYDETVVS